MKIINFNLTTLFLIFISISFFGCAKLTASPGANDVAETDKNQNQIVKGKSEDVPNLNQKKEILWDFRKDTTSEPPKISKAETGVVVKYLFGDRAGQEMEITSRFSGSFTKPDAKETLYYIGGCKNPESGGFTTDCPHPIADSAGWIAVYNGTSPVMKIYADLGEEIVKVTDINGDGIDEILSFYGYSAFGLFDTFVNLGGISGGKYKIIKNFNGFAHHDETENQCIDAASSISYLPTTDSKMPVFTLEYFQSDCRNENSQWKKITKKQFDKFFEN